MAFAAILVGSIAVMTFTDFNNGLLLAVTYIWVELLDFGVYSYFRRFGWLTGMVTANVIASPLVPIIFHALDSSHFLFNIDTIIVRYIVLMLTYICLYLSRHRLNAFGKYPMFVTEDGHIKG
jgi:hypothetical protein